MDDSERDSSGSKTGIRGIDLESIGEQAEKIFGNEGEEEGEAAMLDLDGTGRVCHGIFWNILKWCSWPLAKLGQGPTLSANQEQR